MSTRHHWMGCFTILLVITNFIFSLPFLGGAGTKFWLLDVCTCGVWLWIVLFAGGSHCKWTLYERKERILLSEQQRPIATTTVVTAAATAVPTTKTTSAALATTFATSVPSHDSDLSPLHAGTDPRSTSSHVLLQVPTTATTTPCATTAHSNQQIGSRTEGANVIGHNKVTVDPTAAEQAALNKGVCEICCVAIGPCLALVVIHLYYLVLYVGDPPNREWLEKGERWDCRRRGAGSCTPVIARMALAWITIAWLCFDFAVMFKAQQRMIQRRMAAQTEQIEMPRVVPVRNKESPKSSVVTKDTPASSL